MDLSKLPKWAQNHIQRLESDLRNEKRKVEVLTRGAEPIPNHAESPSRVNRLHLLEQYPLPEDQAYSFKLSDRRNDIIKVSLKGDKLELYHTSDVEMVIEPTATNIFNVRFIDFNNRMPLNKGL